MPSEIADDIEFEISQIDDLLQTYAELLENSQKQTPGLVEVTAIGAVLHSFYNGLENIFLAVAKRLDHNIPAGDHWHRELLGLMTAKSSNREALISIATERALSNYLGFRHLFRHSYSKMLKWSELEKLVVDLHSVWMQARTELLAFLQTLDGS